jgi:hypothetical protein
MFTITDLEQLQAEHPEWQMELVDGSMLVMSMSVKTSAFLNAEGRKGKRRGSQSFRYELMQPRTANFIQLGNFIIS